MDPRIRELPCSAKLVYKVLEYKGSATFKEIKEETCLPERTIREAIRILREKGLVSARICLQDTRSKVYTISECVSLRNPEI